MTEVKCVTALTGSTRGVKTASESIIDYLDARLGEGVQIKKYRAHQIFQDEVQKESFIKYLEKSDLILICSPVYVHSLPYPLVSLMEQLSRETDKDFWQNKKMMAVIHNGYPEDIQRKPSFEICRNFAEEMGMEWLGGIGFGGSPIIDGKPLEELGWFTKWMRRALDEMSNSIKTGEEISEKTRKFASKHFPSIPLWILKPLMNLRIKSMARKKGIDLFAQPYLNTPEEES
jgi:multimeric flavodoxin WrbA